MKKKKILSNRKKKGITEGSVTEKAVIFKTNLSY